MNAFPKKSLGQHFLVGGGVLRKMVAAADLSAGDVVLEIGPGLGVLTNELAKKAKKIIAVEKDEGLVRFLKQRFRKKNVEIVPGDILKFNPKHYELRPRRYKVVANVPYYLTGKLLRLVFESWPKPKLVVLMLQKEVALRILARPPKLSLLGLAVQLSSRPRLIGFVRPSAFRPRPKVDSAIVSFAPENRFSLKQKRKILGVARLGFKQPRKLLLNNLKKTYLKTKLKEVFGSLGIPFSARPGDLTLTEWLGLADSLSTSQS